MGCLRATEITALIVLIVLVGPQGGDYSKSAGFLLLCGVPPWNFPLCRAPFRDRQRVRPSPIRSLPGILTPQRHLLVSSELQPGSPPGGGNAAGRRCAPHPTVSYLLIKTTSRRETKILMISETSARAMPLIP